jgi:hypothetical protein
MRRWHRVGSALGLFGHYRIFVASQGVRVELKGFAHKFGDAVILWLVMKRCHIFSGRLPPDDYFVNHAAPKSGNG